MRASAMKLREKGSKKYCEICTLLTTRWTINRTVGISIRPIINHPNTAFRSAVSDGKSQAIDEHMTKFKGKHSARQYLKNKPIKWGFKWWCRADSKMDTCTSLIYISEKRSLSSIIWVNRW